MATPEPNTPSAACAAGVAPEALAYLTRQAFHDTSFFLRTDHLRQVAAILDDPEASANDRFVALDLLKNASIAAGFVLPGCQDTGTAIVKGKKGQLVFTIEQDWPERGFRTGDVLAYEMKVSGKEFVDAAKALGCWVDDGRPQVQTKPTPLSPRLALSVMAFESTLAAVAAGNVAQGVTLTDAEIEAVSAKIVEKVAKATGGVLRS